MVTWWMELHELLTFFAWLRLAKSHLIHYYTILDSSAPCVHAGIIRLVAHECRVGNTGIICRANLPTGTRKALLRCSVSPPKYYEQHRHELRLQCWLRNLRPRTTEQCLPHTVPPEPGILLPFPRPDSTRGTKHISQHPSHRKSCHAGTTLRLERCRHLSRWDVADAVPSPSPIDSSLPK